MHFGGIWVRCCEGEVIVGVKESDPDFDAAGKTGGAKTKAISAHAGAAVADHASHSHTYSQVVDHVHTLATGSGATGNFSQVVGAVDTSSGGTGGTPTQTALATRSGTPVGSAGATGTTNGPGAALSHNVTQPSNHSDINVLPPYRCYYEWERIA